MDKSRLCHSLFSHFSGLLDKLEINFAKNKEGEGGATSTFQMENRPPCDISF